MHCTSPFEHSTQTPLAQRNGAAQAVPFSHCPLVAQVCGVSEDVGLQRGASPGVHAQQLPSVHPSGQALFIQCPVPSQTWLVFPMHCLAGAVQSLHSLFEHIVQTT